MKRKLFLLLNTAMILALYLFAGCGNENTSTSIDDAEIEDDESDERDVHDENSDEDSLEEILRIVTGYGYGNYSYFVVENISDTPILNFDLIYLSFDENGFSTESDYRIGNADGQNLMPGSKTILSFYGTAGKYAKATPSRIEFSDDTERVLDEDAIEAWCEKYKKGISIDEEKEKLEALAEDAKLATSNDYISLDSFEIVKDNKYSDKKDFNFELTNHTDQGVLEVDLYVLQFDGSGFPVPVSPYDTYCLNGRTTSGSSNLAAGASGSYSSSLFCESATANCMAILTEIKFQDDTRWVNPYMYEWIVVNNKSYSSKTNSDDAVSEDVAEEQMQMAEFVAFTSTFNETEDKIDNAWEDASDLVKRWVAYGTCDISRLQEDIDDLREYYEQMLSVDLDNDYIKRMQNNIQTVYDSLPNVQDHSAESFKDAFMHYLTLDGERLQLKKDILSEIQEKLDENASESSADIINPELPADVMKVITGVFHNISVTEETQLLYVSGDKAQLEVSKDGKPSPAVNYSYNVMPDTFSHSDKAVAIGKNEDIEYIITVLDGNTLIIAAPEGSGSTQYSGAYERVAND